jgi:hypothetical protein
MRKLRWTEGTVGMYERTRGLDLDSYVEVRIIGIFPKICDRVGIQRLCEELYGIHVRVKLWARGLRQLQFCICFIYSVNQ